MNLNDEIKARITTELGESALGGGEDYWRVGEGMTSGWLTFRPAVLPDTEGKVYLAAGRRRDSDLGSPYQVHETSRSFWGASEVAARLLPLYIGVARGEVL